MSRRKTTFAEWRTAPISATCEVRNGDGCHKPTTHAYKAMNRGWMSLCWEHAQNHLNHSQPITELILSGEILIKRDKPIEAK